MSDLKYEPIWVGALVELMAYTRRFSGGTERDRWARARKLFTGL